MQTHNTTPRQYIERNITDFPRIHINTPVHRQSMEEDVKEIEKRINADLDRQSIVITDPMEYWNNVFCPKKKVVLNNLHYEEETKENISNNIPKKLSLLERRSLMKQNLSATKKQFEL